jgi:hypothetical protein
LAAARLDALGLRGGGKRVQGPLRRLVGLLGPIQAEGAVGLAAKPPGRVGGDQGDDPPALQLRKPPRAARACLIAEGVDAALVEAVQPAIDRRGMAAKLRGDLVDLSAVPACGDDASALQPARRAWRALARRRIQCSSAVSAGGRAYSGGSMAPPFASQRTQHHQEILCSHIEFEERSTNAQFLRSGR